MLEQYISVPDSESDKRIPGIDTYCAGAVPVDTDRFAFNKSVGHSARARAAAPQAIDVFGLFIRTRDSGMEMYSNSVRSHTGGRGGGVWSNMHTECVPEAGNHLSVYPPPHTLTHRLLVRIPPLV
jgi:hypothetical protein